MYLRYIMPWIFVLAMCSVIFCQVCNDPECAIIQNVTHDYWKNVVPRCDDNTSLPVEVEIQLLLRQVVELDGLKQILSTNVWIRLMWMDCHLRWDPAEYNGTDVIYFPYDSIWTPDITLYDDSAFGSDVAMSERNIHRLEVHSNGMVKQKFPSVLSSICGVDATYFPFDKQRCPLKFGPWVHDKTKVNLYTTTDGDTTSFVQNAEWVLLSVRGVNSTSKYDGESFTEVLFTVEIRRRPTFFMLTLFFPCFLLTSLSVTGFFLPPYFELKVGQQVTLLLALTVFQFLTLGLVPSNSEPLPLMCVYFSLVMMLASISVMLSVVVLKVHIKGEQGWKVSPRLKNLLIDKLGKLLRVKRPHMLREYAVKTMHVNQAVELDEELAAPTAQNYDTSDPQLRVTLKAFEKVTEQFKKLVQHLEERKAVEDSVEYQDWLTIASVLDRLFLILYFIFSLIVILSFIINLAS